MLASGAGFVVAASLFVACAWSSYVAALRLLPRAPISVRLVAQLVIVWTGLVVAFFVLAAFAGFRLWIVTPMCLAVAGACAFGGAALGRQARADLHALRRGWAGLGRGVRAIVLAFGLLLLARLARGLVAPPLAWDALTYHLVHAARFVQAGGFVRELAPDNWGFYEFFPIAGEVLWAWAMLPVGTDALLAPACALVVVATLVAAYACARSLEVPRERATLMAISVAGSPALIAWATSGYVDNIVVALTAAGSLFIVRNGVRPSAREAALAMAAFGLAASVKVSALPLVACALIALALQAAVPGPGSRSAAQRARSLALAALPAGVCLVHLIRTWLATGNPLYPFGLDLFGTPIFEGNAEWQWRLVDWGTEYQPPPGAPTAFERTLGLFWPFGDTREIKGAFLNFGPAGIALIALAPLGAVTLFSRRERRVATLLLAAVAAIAIYGFAFSPGSAHLQHFYAANAGRYLGTALFALGVLASVARVPAAGPVWAAIAVATLLVGLPRGWSGREVPAALAAAVVSLAVAGSAIWLFRSRVRAAPLARAARVAAVAVMIGVLGAGLTWVRDELRFRIYAASARSEAFDADPLRPDFASSWTIWHAIDGLPAQRIAVATGWAGLPHNGYRYPLFGSRLQHQLLYVSPTRSGEIVDYRLAKRLRRAANFEAWLSRLIAREITLVVTLEPDTTPESAWAKASPELFAPLATSESGASHAFLFDPGRARARLQAGRGGATPE